MAPRVEDESLTVDRALLSAMVRQRARFWLFGGLAAFVVFAAIGLFLMSQSFQSIVSLSVQQPAPSGTAALFGLGGVMPGAKKYVGIIKSHRIAKEVEELLEQQEPALNVKSVYELPSTEKAISLIERSVKANDNLADGLLYITIALDGPARFGRDPGGRRGKVRLLAARLGNEYAAALRRYYVTSDNDRDTVLQRGANEQLRRSKQAYEESISRLSDYIRSQGSAREVTAMPVDPATAVVVATQMHGLYLELGKAEADLRGAEATREARSRLQAKQLENLPSLPLEDPLLSAARRDVAEAEADVKNLREVYADDAPKVRNARARLRHAQERLRQEEEGVRQGQTTERVRSKAEVEGYQAKYDAVKRQLAEAERTFQHGRALSTAFERLRNDVNLKLEVLKKAASEAASLRMQTVSAQSRMTVVDNARPAPYGQPGIAVILLTSLFGALAALGAWIVGEYMLRAQKRAEG